MIRVDRHSGEASWRKLAPSYQEALRRDRENIREKVGRGHLVSLRRIETPELWPRFGHLVEPGRGW